MTIDVVVFDTQAERTDLHRIIENVASSKGEDGAILFYVSGGGADYFEVTGETSDIGTLRIRVAGKQIWVEDREDLPFYVGEELKEECLPYARSYGRAIGLEEFAARQPRAIDLREGDIEFRYNGLV